MTDFDTDFMTGNGEINLDFTDVQEMDFSAAVAGSYLAVITNAELKPSSQKKTPGLNVTFEIIGCVENPAPKGSEKATGKKAFATFWMTKESMGFNKPFFNALAGGEATTVSFKPEQLVGTQVGIVVKPGTYVKEDDAGNKETREKTDITGYFPANAV